MIHLLKTLPITLPILIVQTTLQNGRSPKLCRHPALPIGGEASGLRPLVHKI